MEQNTTAGQKLTGPHTVIIAEYVRKDDQFDTRGLTYGINAKGLHVVIRHSRYGEDICPDYFRYETIEEARACWKRLVTALKEKGYTLDAAETKKRTDAIHAFDLRARQGVDA